MEFQILKKSKKSKARLGILKTENGVIETPSLVPVATRAVIKTLTSEEVKQTKTQLIISNTFHLHLRPGENVVKKAGKLHKFMNWDRPIMTDSGGFQVFSLGFGRDFGVNKIVKSKTKKEEAIKRFQQPKEVRITDDGAFFRSPIDGKKLFLGPKESIKIQEKLGADIIFAFDECPPPHANFDYVKDSMEKTHRWADVCLKTKGSRQALFGIVQGSEFKRLRQESSKIIGAMGFDGFGIGGDMGINRNMTRQVLSWAIPNLDEKKPRHLLGIGYLENMEDIIKEGVDLFDCTVPTHYARRGIAFVSSGKLDLRKEIFLNDKKPLDKKCECFVCQNYKRNYICHLFRANEITAMRLVTFHNLFFFNTYVENIRKKIKEGKI